MAQPSTETPKKPVREIENAVEALLAQGLSRADAFGRFAGASEAEQAQAAHFLNDAVELRSRRQYLYPNLAVCLVLAYITLRGLVLAFQMVDAGLWMITYLIAPMIHLYVLRQLLRFRKIGYQLLFVLSLLSLLNPENRALPELVLFPALAVAAGLLYLRLFPKGATRVGKR